MSSEPLILSVFKLEYSEIVDAMFGAHEVTRGDILASCCDNTGKFDVDEFYNDMLTSIFGSDTIEFINQYCCVSFCERLYGDIRELYMQKIYEKCENTLGFKLVEQENEDVYLLTVVDRDNMVLQSNNGTNYVVNGDGNLEEVDLVEEEEEYLQAVEVEDELPILEDVPVSLSAEQEEQHNKFRELMKDAFELTDKVFERPIIECPVCYESHKGHHVFTCDHPLCFDCWMNLVKHSRTNSIKCPMCRCTTLSGKLF
jgi:hypothetical protein